jgi:hypothetical protein
MYATRKRLMGMAHAHGLLEQVRAPNGVPPASGVFDLSRWP